ALVLAAAGNSTGGSHSNSGALLPAAWSTHPAPTTGECVHDYFGEPVQAELPPSFGERPLLYAVGGVDGRGAALANARRSAQPAIVAHADQAVTEDQNGYLDGLTGTSVSTAVVSAAAALLWSYAPDLHADDVLTLIYESGETLGVADFGYGGAAPVSVRRVNACQALSHACTALGVCELSEECPEWKRVLPEQPSDLQLGAFPGVKVFSPMFPSVPQSVPMCGSRDVYADDPSALEIAPCPDLQYHNEFARPWTDPQPDDPRCPNCRAMRLRSVIVLETDTVLDSSSVLGLSVERAGITSTYTLSQTQWPQNTTEARLELPTAFLDNADAVRLDMNVSGTYTSVPIGMTE
ncbi:MAG: S8 family serine peptidase, partial [Myxococcota bacterium]